MLALLLGFWLPCVLLGALVLCIMAFAPPTLWHQW